MIQVIKSYEKPPYLRDAQLSIRYSDSGFKASFIFTYLNEQVVSDPDIDLQFDREMLKHLLNDIEKSLSAAAQNGVWTDLKDPIRKPQSSLACSKYQEFMETVVSKGSTLYRHLKKIHQFDEFLQRIEDLPDGSRITIQTEGAILPWEILYPFDFNEHSPAKKKIDSSKLWGCRFEIEQMILRKNKLTSWTVKNHQNSNAYVSLNFNPMIERELSQGPFPSSYKPLKETENFYNNKIGEGRGKLLTEGHKIVSTVLSESPATIIYLYCHGKSADSRTDELLEVDEKVFIAPDTVAAEDYHYTSGPLIILNSCSSGAYSPLSLTNFYSEFKDKCAIGVIGTMMAMPATFAAAFGIRLIDDYVNYAGDQPVTIGSVLRCLRRELIEFDNPLGLFYVLQCPLHATAKRA
jgi:hypothetical protein